MTSGVLRVVSQWMVGGSKIIASGDMCRRQWKPVIASAKQFPLADKFTQSMFLYTDLG